MHVVLRLASTFTHSPPNLSITNEMNECSRQISKSIHTLQSTATQIIIIICILQRLHILHFYYLLCYITSTSDSVFSPFDSIIKRNKKIEMQMFRRRRNGENFNKSLMLLLMYIYYILQGKEKADTSKLP